MDVYLYSFGDPSAELVLHHVAYGDASPYETLAAGDYTVAMRAAGAGSTTKPALSASITVGRGTPTRWPGSARSRGCGSRFSTTELTPPAGKALVRVIQASLKEHLVTVSYGGGALVSGLAFGSVSAYKTVSPRTVTVRVAGAGSTSSTVTVAAGTVHTLVVLDGASGLEVDNLVDAAGSAVLPAGGAATGFGGTAPRVPVAVALAGSRRGGRARRGRRRTLPCAGFPTPCLTIVQRKHLAVLALAVGLIAAGAGAAGLVHSRHPVAVRWASAGSLPVPIGPIAALPQSRNGDKVPRPVALIIPSIGVQTKLTDLGVTASGALQVPSSTAVAGWYTSSPRPGAIGLGGDRRAHRLAQRPRRLLLPVAAAARRPDLRAAGGRDAGALPCHGGAVIREEEFPHPRRLRPGA